MYCYKCDENERAKIEESTVEVTSGTWYITKARCSKCNDVVMENRHFVHSKKE